MSIPLHCVLLLTILATTHVQADDSLGLITIHSKQARTGHLLVSSELNLDIPDGDYALRDSDSELVLSAQLTKRKLFVSLPQPWPAKTGKRFEIHLRDQTQAKRFEFEQEHGDLEFQLNKRPILTYNEKIDEPPAGADSLYRKSGYLHPVYSPAGQVLTDDFPVDHYHQHGIFSAWVKTTIDGQEVDFWNQAKGEGTVLHSRLLDRFAGSVTAGFDTELEHIMNPGDNSRTVLKELWKVRIHPHERYHIWELSSQQTNVSGDDFTLNEYHYGGFAFRGRSDWLGTFPQSGCEMRTDKVDSREAGNHQPARWVVISGLVNSEDGQAEQFSNRSGLVMMSHPQNLRSPQKVRLHPNKPYFCFCPVINEEFFFKSGLSLVSNYLVITFDGQISEEVLEEIWQEYSHPLEIDFVETKN